MTSNNRLFNVHNKKMSPRKKVTETRITDLEIKDNDPLKLIERGVIRKIFDNTYKFHYDSHE